MSMLCHLPLSGKTHSAHLAVTSTLMTLASMLHYMVTCLQSRILFCNQQTSLEAPSSLRVKLEALGPHKMLQAWHRETVGCCKVRGATMLLCFAGIASTSAATSLQLRSSFLHALQTSTWLPSTAGTLHQPGALFMPDRETIALLGDHVPYLKCSIKDPNFIQTLGVTTEVTWQDILRLLSKWAKDKHFRASLEQMSNLYSFLGAAVGSDPAAAEAICTAFEELPLVWLPSKGASEHSVRSIRSMLSSAVSEAGTPLRRGVVPYEITPTPTSALGRKSRQKFSFVAPGTGTQRQGTSGPPHTPHTPTWGVAPSSQQLDGQFYMASGDQLRLYDSTGVLEGISDDKLALRILSEHYTSPTAMQFFSQDLVTSSSYTASPTQQPASAGHQTQPEIRQAQADAAPQVQDPQQQQEQQQQRSPVQQPVQQLHQQELPDALQQQPARPQRQVQSSSGQQPFSRLEEYIDLRSDTDTDMDLSQPSPNPSPLKAAATPHTADAPSAQLMPPASASAVAAGPSKAVLRAHVPTEVSKPEAEAARQSDPLSGQGLNQAAQLADTQQQPSAGGAAHASLQPDVDMLSSRAVTASDLPSNVAATNEAHTPSAATPAPAPTADPTTTPAGAHSAAAVTSPAHPAADETQSPAESAYAPQLLIQAEPSCQEYCQALQAVATPVAPAYHTVQLTKVLAILNR